jgi:hypothetical protein
MVALSTSPKAGRVRRIGHESMSPTPERIMLGCARRQLCSCSVLLPSLLTAGTLLLHPSKKSVLLVFNKSSNFKFNKIYIKNARIYCTN